MVLIFAGVETFVYRNLSIKSVLVSFDRITLDQRVGKTSDQRRTVEM